MDRSHLVPEQRTDRNGKTSTRWVKQSSAEALATLGIKPTPPPTLTYTQNLAAKRINRITEFTGERRQRGVMEKWIAAMPKLELDALDSALEVCEDPSSDAAVVRERVVLRSVFDSLAKGSSDDDRMVLELIILRKAFCSEWAQQEHPPVQYSELASYLHGFKRGAALPLNDERLVKGMTATVRFAYEMDNRFYNAEFLPTIKDEEDHLDFSSIRTSYREYVTPELANLVFQYPDDTERLIELAGKHETNDAKVLRGLFENEGGAAPLVSGWL